MLLVCEILKLCNVRSWDKLKLWNLQQCSRYGRQTCQGGNIALGVPTLKVIKYINPMMLSGQWQIEYFYLRLQNTHDHETRQSGDLPWIAPILKEIWPPFVTWKIDKIICTFSQDLWLWLGSSERKRPSPHWLLLSFETGWLEWGRYCIWKIKLFSSLVHFIIFCFLEFYLTVFYAIFHVQAFSYWTVQEFQLLSF